MTRWRRMKTAPTDGTPILATDGRTVTTVYYYDTCCRYWSLVEAGSYAEDAWYDPVAWMPCPKPPRVR